MVQNIMVDLIHVSEKAANIARVFRQNENLLNLLTEEKSEAEANPRFVKDYKTLADVLIQETIRHEIGKLVRTYKYLTFYLFLIDALKLLLLNIM